MDKKSKIHSILIFGCLLTALLTFFFLYSAYLEQKRSIEKTKAFAHKQVEETAIATDSLFAGITESAKLLGKKITAGEIDRGEINQHLEQILKSTPKLFGIGVAYIPYIYDPEVRKKSPYYLSRSELTDSISQDLLQVITVPFTLGLDSTGQKITSGVIFVDFLKQELEQTLSSMELGKTGYGFILSMDGIFIAHPVQEYVKSQQTIFDVAELLGDYQLVDLGRSATNGDRGIIDYKDAMTGQSSWIFYEPIPSVGWSLAITYFNDEQTGTTSNRTQLIIATVLAIIFLTILTTLFFRAYEGDSQQIWKVSTVLSILLTVGIGVLWYLEQTTSFNEETDSIIVVDESGLRKFLNKYEAQNSKTNAPIYLATGIVLDTIEFMESNNVIVSGTVWQRYEKGVHDDLTRGVVFPEAREVTIKESYRLQEEGSEVIGWHFEGTLRQEYEYSKYPFDRRQLNLWVSPADIDQHVILTPDFDSYEIMSPLSLPGLKNDLVLPKWDIKKSFFSYHQHHSKINFGLRHSQSNLDKPRLNISVLMKRKFVTPFVSNMLPLMVIGGLLFAFQMLLGQVKSFANLAAPTSALLFGIVLAHVRFRSAVAAEGIVYFEYFYFVIYFAVLLLVANFFIYDAETVGKSLRYKEGLVAKLIFLPTILLTMFIVTTVIFCG